MFDENIRISFIQLIKLRYYFIIIISLASDLVDEYTKFANLYMYRKIKIQLHYHHHLITLSLKCFVISLFQPVSKFYIPAIVWFNFILGHG